MHIFIYPYLKWSNFFSSSFFGCFFFFQIFICVHVHSLCCIFIGCRWCCCRVTLCSALHSWACSFCFLFAPLRLVRAILCVCEKLSSWMPMSETGTHILIFFTLHFLIGIESVVCLLINRKMRERINIHRMLKHIPIFHNHLIQCIGADMAILHVYIHRECTTRSPSILYSVVCW